jgi:cytochrome P450
MLRALRRIGADPLAFLAEQWRLHGDVVQFPIPSPPTYLISHPDDVRTVLVGRARDVGKQTLQYRALATVTGLGLLTADGARWREHRRVLQPAFHPQTLPAVAGHTARASGAMLQRLAEVGPGGVVDVDAEVMTVALEVVGESLFGHQLGPVADQLAEATLTALGEVVALARMPLRAPAWIPTPGNRRMARALSELDDAVAAILARREVDGPQGDMLDLLLAAPMGPREVRDEIVTFLVAGHETVASALTWALVLLSTHPDVADRVAAEATEVLGTSGHGAHASEGMPDEVGVDVLAHLVLARAVVDEAMRLNPPAWLITRRTEAELELGGRAIPAGSLLILSPWIVHRHREAWLDPERFDPDRFLDPAVRAGPARSAFVPFGAGPRMCIGRDFAYAEAVLALALICRGVRLTPTGPPVRPLPLVTIRPDRPAFLRVEPR